LSVTAYVEDALEHALTDLPVVWAIGDGLRVQRVVGTEGRWAWRKVDGTQLAWQIYCETPTSGSFAEPTFVYYDLIVSRDLEAFLLTHSNFNAGIWDIHWLIRNLVFIPFTALTDKPSLLRSNVLSLAELLSDNCLSRQPNLDWPT
jgi:hypothetical protein